MVGFFLGENTPDDDGETREEESESSEERERHRMMIMMDDDEDYDLTPLSVTAAAIIFHDHTNLGSWCCV